MSLRIVPVPSEQVIDFDMGAASKMMEDGEIAMTFSNCVLGQNQMPQRSTCLNGDGVVELHTEGDQLYAPRLMVIGPPEEVRDFMLARVSTLIDSAIEYE